MPAISGHPASAAPRRLRLGVLAICVLSSFCSMALTLSIAPLIGDIARDLGLSVGSASLAFMAVPTLATAVGIALFGIVVDRVGVFPVLLASQAVLALSGLVLPLAGHRLDLLMAVRIVQGLAAAGATVAITPTLAQWFPPAEIGRAMGLPPVGALCGVLSGLNLAPWLAHEAGAWQVGVASLSLFALVALSVSAPIVWWAGRWMAQSRTVFDTVSRSAVPPGQFRRPVFWLGLATSSLAWWVSMGFGDLAPGFLAVDPPLGAGWGAGAAGRWMSVFTLAGAIGSPLAGVLVDRLGLGASHRVVAFGWLLAAVFCSALAIGPVHDRGAILAPVLVLAGMAGSFVNVALMSLAARVFPPEIVGRVCGLWLSVSFFAGAAGVTAGAVGLRVTGRYGASFALIGIVGLLGLALSPWLGRTARAKGLVASGSGDDLERVVT